MDIREEYLKFYKINFGQGRYCSKSWGLASYKAGQQSKQAEIDALQGKISKVLYAISQSELYGDRAVWGIQDEIKELLK